MLSTCKQMPELVVMVSLCTHVTCHGYMPRTSHNTLSGWSEI